jgi:hypothetical protein
MKKRKLAHSLRFVFPKMIAFLLFGMMKASAAVAQQQVFLR